MQATRKTLALLGLVLFIFVSPALAIESICPGGASPRADVVKCMDFETACVSSTSDLCWTDNGFSYRDDHRGTDMEIVTDATNAIVGSRYAKLTGIPGATGTGFATYTFPSPVNEMRIRWYQEFSQYQHYYYNHFLGITIQDPSPACSRGATLEVGGQSSAYLYTSGSCGVPPGSEALHPNQGVAPVFKNGKAYLFEVAIKMDTSCTDALSATGCNGVYKLWVDGVLVISYTDMNWGGASGAQIVDVQPARNYNHKRNGFNVGSVYIDQIVISDDADSANIGAATGATNIGTEVAEAYASECGIDPFYINAGASKSPELDYYGAGGGSISVCGTAGENWRGNAPTANGAVYHTGVIIDSATPTDGDGVTRPLAEQSLRVQCTGANCGAGWFIPRMQGPVTGSEGSGNSNAYSNGAIPQWVIEGYIYLPSASTPNDKITYASFIGKGSASHSNYVGLSENGGFWSITQRDADGTPTIVTTTSTAVTRDTWHRFEIVLWDSEGVSLMIDDVRVLDQVALLASPTWMFDTTHNGSNSGMTLAITDYLGTGTVTAYYDDVSIGSVSRWSCDGWGSDCPNSEPADPDAPVVSTTPGRGGVPPWLF